MLYSIVLISTKHQHESIIGLPMSPPTSNIPPTSLPMVMIISKLLLRFFSLQTWRIVHVCSWIALLTSPAGSKNSVSFLYFILSPSPSVQNDSAFVLIIQWTLLSSDSPVILLVFFSEYNFLDFCHMNRLRIFQILRIRLLFA